jgi:hypothetical protein
MQMNQVCVAECRVTHEIRWQHFDIFRMDVAGTDSMLTNRAHFHYFHAAPGMLVA